MFFCFISAPSYPTPSHWAVYRVKEGLRFGEANPWVYNLHPLFFPSITKDNRPEGCSGTLCYCLCSAYLRMCEAYPLFLTPSQCQLSLFSRLGKTKASNVFTWGWSKARGSLPWPQLAPSRLLAAMGQLGSQELCQWLPRERLLALMYRLFPKISLALALRASVQMSSLPKVLPTMMVT